MIEFINNTDQDLKLGDKYVSWIELMILRNEFVLGDISYTFCLDEELDGMNQQYLKHVDYTDIITFDHTVGSIISGDIFISIERVLENADRFDVEFRVELRRVMAHGVLHLMGFTDDTPNNQSLMRLKENEILNLFHVEH